MSYSHGRQGSYSPLPIGQLGEDVNIIYQSPAVIQGQWNTHDGDMGARPTRHPKRKPVGSPPIEMQNRATPMHQDSTSSMNSQATMFPPLQKKQAYVSQQSYTSQQSETESFLQDPINKLETHTFSTSDYQPYKDNTGRQLWHLLRGSTTRWLITVALCAGYIAAVHVWLKKGSDGKAISENSKRWFNTITTGISLALGLNVASAFKDLSNYMRWPILNGRKRNLKEVDLLLKADSLSALFKLVFVTKRPWIIISCVLWLAINIVAQAGIAMIGLTYGFDVNTDAVIMKAGNVSIPDMSHFFPSLQTANTDFSTFDEQYTAHVYGALYNAYGSDNITNEPKAGDIYKNSNAMLWVDTKPGTNFMEMVFSDSPASSGSTVETSLAVYSERKINITYVCEAHEITANGTGKSNILEVANIGEVAVDTVLPNSTIYFTNPYNFCSDDARCSIVEVFEASDTSPWYYKCNVTLGHTTGDLRNLSYISDDMAFIATSNIAQIGYTDSALQQQQIYPTESLWGGPARGDQRDIGFRVASWALGTIAGASLFNPSITYEGNAPTNGFELTLGHSMPFYLILSLICFSHFIFIVIVAILANRVKVGPEGHLGMSLLLRPIADQLEGVSGGRENTAYEAALQSTQAKYEKSRSGRWHLVTST